MPPETTPYELLGGETAVRALVERFYDAMDEGEPELARLHPLEGGKVSRAVTNAIRLAASRLHANWAASSAKST